METKLKARRTKYGALVITWRDRLAARIRVEHAAIHGAWRESLMHARAAGLLLLEAKGKMGHGYFMTWVRQECGVSHSLANIYMRIAREWTHIEANSERVANLSLGAVDRFIRKGSRTRAAKRPLTETVWTLLGSEERVSKEYPVVLTKLETLVPRLQSVIHLLTEAQAQSAVTSLLTLRGQVDHAIVEVHEHLTDLNRSTSGMSVAATSLTEVSGANAPYCPAESVIQ